MNVKNISATLMRPAPDHPDRELLLLGADFDAYCRDVDPLHADLEVTRSEHWRRELRDQIYAHSDRLDEIMAAMVRHSARTVDGQRAKAKVALRWLGERDGGGSMKDEECVTRSLVKDILREPDAGLLELGRRLAEAWSIQAAALRDAEAEGEAGPMDDRWQECREAASAVVDAILEAQAVSLAGLQVKLRAFHWCRHDGSRKQEITAESITYLEPATAVRLMASILVDIDLLAAGGAQTLPKISPVMRQ